MVAAAPPADSSGGGVIIEPDPALMSFLQETDGFAHLCEPLAAITWDEVDALYKEGRPSCSLASASSASSYPRDRALSPYLPKPPSQSRSSAAYLGADASSRNRLTRSSQSMPWANHSICSTKTWRDIRMPFYATASRHGRMVFSLPMMSTSSSSHVIGPHALRVYPHRARVAATPSRLSSTAGPAARTA